MTNKTICEIHGCEFKPQMVGISYGLPSLDDPYFEARSTQFPNSRMFILGGCCVGSVGYEIEVLVCLECRQIEERWREKNDVLT